MINVIIFSLLGGLLSLVGGLLLLASKKISNNMAWYGTPFAAGVLLATAFTDLIPEAIENTGLPIVVLRWTLVGLLVFFLLERFIHWFHHHHEIDLTKNEQHKEHDGHHLSEKLGKNKKSSATLIMIGDTIHNAVDGVAIGAAFLVSPSTGIVAAIAVAAHEIPQEIGDFGLMLKSGMSRRKVIIANAMSALASTFMAVVAYQFGANFDSYIPYVLATTAGFFIYIACSDIIPELHDHVKKPHRDIRPWVLIFGVLVMLFFTPILHKYIDNHDGGAVHDHALEENQHSDEQHDDE